LTWNHGLINVAMLPYESLCSKNVILQWDITKENCIKRIVYASSKCTCRKGTELAYRPQYNLVIISITRYRDIDRRFIQRTISWRPYIVQYRA